MEPVELLRQKTNRCIRNDYDGQAYDNVFAFSGPMYGQKFARNLDRHLREKLKFFNGFQ